MRTRVFTNGPVSCLTTCCLASTISLKSGLGSVRVIYYNKTKKLVFGVYDWSSGSDESMDAAKYQNRIQLPSTAA